MIRRFLHWAIAFGSLSSLFLETSNSSSFVMQQIEEGSSHNELCDNLNDFCNDTDQQLMVQAMRVKAKRITHEK